MLIIFAPMVVNMLGMKVNVMDRASTISYGPVQQVDWFLSTKRNQGYGEENGDLSPVFAPIDIVNDPDISDSNSIKNSAV